MLDSEFWKSLSSASVISSPPHSASLMPPKPPKEQAKTAEHSKWNPNSLLASNRSLLPSAPQPPTSQEPSPSQPRPPGSSPTSLLQQSTPAPHKDQPREPKASVNDLCVVEEAVANIPGMEMGFEDPPLMQELSSPPKPVVTRGPLNFFALLRDSFCATGNNKLTIPALEEAVLAWQNEATPANCDWRHLAENWCAQIPSGVAFLSGAFPEAQPVDFRPYVTCDMGEGAYQWVGMGRDTDVDLGALTQWWLMRRDSCKAVTSSTTVNAPHAGQEEVAPVEIVNCSDSTWTVCQSRPEEREAFQLQERERFSNPAKPFTYQVHGYTSVVGPIKGASFGQKVKPHPMLVSDRPPFVTIVALVRDAVARLPRGRGIRNDVVELLRDSQYLNPDGQADHAGLSHCVSGALDRLQSESDPCVKYDSVQKIWSNLHLNRTEADFGKFLSAVKGVLTKFTKEFFFFQCVCSTRV